MILKFVMTLFMHVVMRLRNDRYHYLNVPDDELSWVSVDRIMMLGHTIPSIVTAVFLGVKVFPLLSETYAEHLNENGAIIPITIVTCLIPILVINGLLIESILERTSAKYRTFKKTN